MKFCWLLALLLVLPQAGAARLLGTLKSPGELVDVTARGEVLLRPSLPEKAPPRLEVRDPRTFALKRSVSFPAAADQAFLALSPDFRHRAYLTFPRYEGSQLVETNQLVLLGAAGKVIWSARTPGLLYSRSPRFSPDGRLLAVLGAFGYVQLWDVRSGKRLASLLSPGKLADLTTFAQFSPDGVTLVAGFFGGGGQVVAFDTRTFKRLSIFKDHDWRPVRRHVSFTPDGARVVLSDEYGPARVFDVRSGRLVWKVLRPVEICDFLGYNPTLLCAHGAQSADFSPDGKRLLVSFTNGELRVYDAVRRRLLKTLTGKVMFARFTLDGRHFVTLEPYGGDLKAWQMQ